MLTFLFWNMGGDLPTSTLSQIADDRKQRLLRTLGNICRRHAVDLLILAETPLGQAETLAEINIGNKIPFNKPAPGSNCERITIFPRFPNRFISIYGASESAKFTCRRVRLPGRDAFLLFAAHFGSKLYKSEDSQTLAAPVFSPIVRAAEKRAGHQRTILVGDLNLNPFDPAMVGAEGINAVMTRELALREDRIVNGAPYPYFYNPMWSLYGDSNHDISPPGHVDHEPPGTCYFQASESLWYYWYMFDQVLLRPALLPLFSNKDLKILASDGTISFLNHRGLTDKKLLSDHLPIIFRLSI